MFLLSDFQKRDIIKQQLLQAIRCQIEQFFSRAVKDPSPRVKVTALSPDGVVEAYEFEGKGQWLLAVQFHPEMLVRGDDAWLSLFKAFVKASR